MSLGQPEQCLIWSQGPLCNLHTFTFLSVSNDIKQMPTSKGKCINHSFCHGWRLTEVQEWNPCQEPPIECISTFPQGIHISNPYKRAFLHYISPCHCPTLAWYSAFSPGWGHGGLTNTISPLASMEGMKNDQPHVTVIPSYNLISVASHARLERRQRNWPPSDTRIKHLLKPHRCLRMPYHLL